MKLRGNTIFITGAASGIGLQLALAFMKLDNKVIISGRNEMSLQKIAANYPAFITRVCDVGDETSIIDTAKWLQENHKVNVLINNAGVFYDIDLKAENTLEILEEETRINYIGPVKLISLLLPSLLKEKNPVIINMSSGVAYMPLSKTPLYSATKAALHSFSISLRNQLKNTPVKVIEILPPVVDTKLTHELKGSKMPVETFIKKTIHALERGKEEIPIGQSRLLYYFARVSPSLMNYILNRKLN